MSVSGCARSPESLARTAAAARGEPPRRLTAGGAQPRRSPPSRRFHAAAGCLKLGYQGTLSPDSNQNQSGSRCISTRPGMPQCTGEMRHGPGNRDRQVQRGDLCRQFVEIIADVGGGVIVRDRTTPGRHRPDLLRVGIVLQADPGAGRSTQQGREFFEWNRLTARRTPVPAPPRQSDIRRRAEGCKSLAPKLGARGVGTEQRLRLRRQDNVARQDRRKTRDGRLRGRARGGNSRIRGRLRGTTMTSLLAATRRARRPSNSGRPDIRPARRPAPPA